MSPLIYYYIWSVNIYLHMGNVNRGRFYESIYYLPGLTIGKYLCLWYVLKIMELSHLHYVRPYFFNQEINLIADKDKIFYINLLSGGLIWNKANLSSTQCGSNTLVNNNWSMEANLLTIARRPTVTFLF